MQIAERFEDGMLVEYYDNRAEAIIRAFATDTVYEFVRQGSRCWHQVVLPPTTPCYVPPAEDPCDTEFMEAISS